MKKGEASPLPCLTLCCPDGILLASFPAAGGAEGPLLDLGADQLQVLLRCLHHPLEVEHEAVAAPPYGGVVRLEAPAVSVGHVHGHVPPGLQLGAGVVVPVPKLGKASPGTVVPAYAELDLNGLALGVAPLERADHPLSWDNPFILMGPCVPHLSLPFHRFSNEKAPRVCPGSLAGSRRLASWVGRAPSRDGEGSPIGDQGVEVLADQSLVLDERFVHPVVRSLGEVGEGLRERPAYAAHRSVDLP